MSPIRSWSLTMKAWWARQGSNLRPIGYEPTALPLSYEPTRKWRFKRTQGPMECQGIRPSSAAPWPSGRAADKYFVTVCQPRPRRARR